MPTDSGLNLTATGIDNHTLNASVKISPAGGNALTRTVAGLYCPAPGAAAATTINSTPTVDATLVSPGVYTLAVGKSTDGCNALVLGSDSKLYVNGVEEPNSLGFFVDATDIYFQFQGPSTNNTHYVVEVQGTTGSPSAWIPASFDSLSGPVLTYSVGARTLSATIRARVKYVCQGTGSQQSNWVGLTFDPPYSLISEDNTLSIVPSSSGYTNEWNATIATTEIAYTLSAGYTTPDMSPEEDSLLKVYKSGEFVTISGVVTSNGTSGTVLTLPLGSRPAIDRQVIFAAPRIGLGVSVPNEFYLLNLGSNGILSSRQTVVNNNISLAINITFKVA
jgi:hypothetical protein